MRLLALVSSTLVLLLSTPLALAEPSDTASAITSTSTLTLTKTLVQATIREGKCEFVGVDSSQFRFLLRFDDDDDRDGFERGDDAAIFGPWRCG